MSKPLLIELLTEELPPSALITLSKSLNATMVDTLIKHEMLDSDPTYHIFETPRRLASLIQNVKRHSPSKEVNVKLVPLQIGFDRNKNPTPTLLKKLKSMGMSEKNLDEIFCDNTGKVAMLHIKQKTYGSSVEEIVNEGLKNAIKKMPIPKLMTYQLDDGLTTAKFVRPLRNLVIMHGDKTLNTELLGISSGNHTIGHRFLNNKKLHIANIDNYEEMLEKEGKVIVSTAKRKEKIEEQCQKHADHLGYNWRTSSVSRLLDEVANLVEYPVVYVTSFDDKFLELPPECLVLTMTTNQKYFPLFDKNNQLVNQFLLVSNMLMDDPSNIIEGNQRVITPRLQDARFFFETDCKSRLDAKVLLLKNVVFQNQLGTQFDRAQRISLLASKIATLLKFSKDEAKRAGYLCKADLISEMVGEFPELQGIMGKYYALNDGESQSVAQAIEDHYLPRFYGDSIPKKETSICVALAEKLDLLVAIFSINLAPTGDKDPYALRRCALGVVRILIENHLKIDLNRLLEETCHNFPSINSDKICSSIYDFILERLRGYLKGMGFMVDEIEAVITKKPSSFDTIIPILKSISSFKALEEAANLSAANKRIKNILRKNPLVNTNIVVEHFEHEAEFEINKIIKELNPIIEPLIKNRNYEDALGLLTKISHKLDTFFEKVMVMDKNESKRENRLALLAALEALMNRIVNLSELQIAKIKEKN